MYRYQGKMYLGLIVGQTSVQILNPIRNGEGLFHCIVFSSIAQWAKLKVVRQERVVMT